MAAWTQHLRDLIESYRVIAFGLLLVGLGLVNGCAAPNYYWRAPELASAGEVGYLDAALREAGRPTVQLASLSFSEPVWQSVEVSKNQAESCYALALAAYEQADFDRATHRSVDAAIAAWYWIDMQARTAAPYGIAPASGAATPETSQRALDLYHSSVTLLIQAAQASERLDPQRGVRLDTRAGEKWLRIAYRGFAWRPEDFDRWEPVGDYQAKRVTEEHRQSGWGVPLVVVREGDESSRFFNERSPMNATALLRPDDPAFFGVRSATGLEAHYLPFTLEVFNPHEISQIPGRGGSMVSLAADKSAMFAWVDRNRPPRYLNEFLDPDHGMGEGKLVMLEPYQPGKIPVILIHGLLSEPLVWLSLANRLRADSELDRQYQIWVFSYPTGKSFLQSAEDLRRESRALISQLAAQYDDPALSHAVLVGHSMGGLISKLQIIHSDQLIWSAISDHPFDELIASAEEKSWLEGQVFFEPSPFVRRVVFMGTPHHGARMASAAIGQLGTRLIRRDLEVTRYYMELARNNPEILQRVFGKRVPTSVDLLRPNNSLLEAMLAARIAEGVHLHSIIGVGHNFWFERNGDGIVAMESARHPGVESELLVDAGHTDLHSCPEAIIELSRVLRLHHASYVEWLAGERYRQVGWREPVEQTSGERAGSESWLDGMTPAR